MCWFELHAITNFLCSPSPPPSFYYCITNDRHTESVQFIRKCFNYVDTRRSWWSHFLLIRIIITECIAGGINDNATVDLKENWPTPRVIQRFRGAFQFQWWKEKNCVWWNKVHLSECAVQCELWVSGRCVIWNNNLPANYTLSLIEEPVQCPVTTEAIECAHVRECSLISRRKVDTGQGTDIRIVHFWKEKWRKAKCAAWSAKGQRN